MMACGPTDAPHVASPSRPPAIARKEVLAVDHEALARVAQENGILDVAAEHLRLVFEKQQSASSKLAFGRALADAWAFERARTLLGDDPSVPGGDLRALEPDADAIERMTQALASHDAKRERDELPATVNPRSAPLVLELVGRLHWALGELVLARKAWARARSRIDASGGRIGMLANAAGAVEALDFHDGRMLVARSRERYLVGGYQSSRTHTVWIEEYAMGDADPLLRWPIGNVAALAVSADHAAVALADHPVEDVSGPLPETARVFDARTGREVAHWAAPDVGNWSKPTNVMHFAAGTLFASHEHDVVAWDLLTQPGQVMRTLPIKGTTQSAIHAYGVSQPIPTTYPSVPSVIDVARDGTVVVGASDGAIWIWPSGNKPAFHFDSASAPPVDERDAMKRQPLALYGGGSSSLLVATGDGAVTRWDVTTRKHRPVVDGRCTEKELGNGAYGPPTPDTLVSCASARNAAFSPDGSRVIFASLMGGPRVRDTKTGAPLATFDTLASDAMTFTDDAGTSAWLGGVDGTIDRWDTQTGERTASLSQGGINGFLKSLSPDGRFVVVMDGGGGYHMASKLQIRVWDVAAHHVVEGLPADLVDASVVDASTLLVTTRSGAFLFDLGTRKHIAELGSSESSYVVSAERNRIVSMRGGREIVVRDVSGGLWRVVREVDVGAMVWGLALDRGAHTAATRSEADELVVWDLDAGRALMRMPAPHDPVLALSPDGRSVMWRSGPKDIVVTSVDDKHEIARLTTKDLAPNQDYNPIDACAFASDTEALVVGPGEPGYSRVFRWTIGGKARGTELQVLTGERIETWPSGVAAIYDRNDSVHLLRMADSVLLASVYATRGGGFLAMSREGAVDGSPEGRSAAITLVDGSDARAGMSSWLGWDRFEIADLIPRTARGEVVHPPIAGLVLRSDTLK